MSLTTDMAMRAMNMKAVDREVFVGVDLGQRESHTAFVVLERFEVMPSCTDMLRGMGAKRRYVVRQAERMPLGTPYPEVVMRVKALVAKLNGDCVLIVDGSGVGVPVVEMMREVGMACHIIPIVITSGQQATGTSVPRVELVTKLQMMVQREELEIAGGCRYGDELVKELSHLQLSKGGGDGSNDDLAIALALACWKARGR